LLTELAAYAAGQVHLVSRADGTENKWIQSFDTLNVTGNGVRDKRDGRTILKRLLDKLFAKW